MAGKDFHPGNEVPGSGIYDVLHDKNHFEAHQVTCIKGYHFPPCRNCGDKAVFRLAKAALHISEDDAFNPDGDPREEKTRRATNMGNLLSAVGEAVDGIYRPGMIVSQSGIYDVLHDDKHKEPHQVTCVKGDKFPPCRGCTSKVRFKINTIAEHIKTDGHLK